MTSSSTLADSLARAAWIGLLQEAEASKYVTSHEWWIDRLKGRVDEWHAQAADYDDGDPVGSGETEAAAIADLQEKIADENDFNRATAHQQEK